MWSAHFIHWMRPERSSKQYGGYGEIGQPFQPEAWKKLASGKYLLEVTASDEHGRPCRAEQEFVLFSLKTGFLR